MKKLLPLAVLSMSFIGCASVDFNDKNDIDKGFMYYPAKPFLLVEKKEEGTVSKIISLPDTEHPAWIKQGEGWGSSEMSFEIENGMIKTFNSKSDSKGPETLTAIAGLATAQSALDTVDASIKIAKLAAKSKVSGSEKKATIGLFNDLATELETKVLNVLKAKPELFQYELSILQENITLLENSAVIMYKESDDGNIDELLTKIETTRKTAGLISEQLKVVLSTISIYSDNTAELPELITLAATVKKDLKNAADTLSTFSKRSSSIHGLYEIKFHRGKLSLTKVLINH